MIKTALAAGLAAGSLLTLSAGSSLAAPPATDRTVATKVAEATTIRPAAVNEGEEDTTCSRARRRLWIEGEGWVVRRITTCR